jgi:Flp pilus assembly protein TadD
MRANRERTINPAWLVRGTCLAESARESRCAPAVRCYSDSKFPMLFRALVVATALVVFAPPALAVAAEPVDADARSEAKEQVEFGIKVAQSGLWKEAAYRWERAVQIDPTYGAAWNNLAIAHEQQGNFDKAREAYEKAVTLEPKNLLFRQNYDLFKEINDRAKRRRDR